MSERSESARSISGDQRLIPSTVDRIAYERNMREIDRLVITGKYAHIVAWGKWLGFTPVTVQDYLTQADADNAPVDAIQKIDGEWIRVGDIVNETNRNRVEALVASVCVRNESSKNR